MRIPTYDNKVTPSSGQVYRSVAQPRSDDLEAVISGIGSIADEMKRRNDEAIAISDYTNMANADLAITQLGESIKDEIANGGKYSDAVKRFNDGYAKIQSQYANVVQDPRSRAEFSVRSQRAGLQYNLSLKDAVRSRSRADATSAANNKVALLQDQLVRMETGMGPVDPKARQAILAEMSSTIAPLERMGVLSAGEGQSKMRGIIGDTEKTVVRIMAEHDPQKALTRLESGFQSGAIDPDVYASMLGPIKDAVQKTQVVANALNLLGTNPGKMQQDDVDLAFDGLVTKGLSADSEQYPQTIIQIANTTRKLPTQVENQMSQILSVPEEQLKPEEAAAFSQYAQMSKSISPAVLAKLPDSTQAALRFVSDSVDAGIPEQTAVKQASAALKAMSNPEDVEKSFDKFVEKSLYAEGANYLADKLDQTFIERALPGQQAYQPTPDMRRIFESRSFMYSQMGDSVKDAQKKAYADLQRVYQPFDGKMMKYSPVVTTGLKEDQFKKMAIEEPLKKAGLYQEGATFTVVSDGLTEQQFLSGQKPTYPLYMTTDAGTLQRVLNKNNQPLRSMPVTVVDYEPFSFIESTRAVLSDEQGRGMLEKYGRK